MNLEEMFVEKYRLLETENRQLKEAEDAYLKEIAELKAEIAKMKADREEVATAIVHGLNAKVENSTYRDCYYLTASDLIWSDNPSFAKICNFLGIEVEEPTIETRPQEREEGEIR